MKRFLAGAVALTLILAGCGGAQTNKPAETKPAESKPAAPEQPKIAKLTIGYVPSSEAAKIDDKVKPLNDYLSKELGIPVETFVGTNYVAAVEAMGSKQVDVGFLNTLSYVMANNDYGVKVILKTQRKGSSTYRAQLTARAEDKIPVCDEKADAKCTKTFEALKGKKLAFVDAASTSGYMYPVSFMKKAGIDTEKGKWFSDILNAGQHDAAVKAVYNKTVDASWSFEDARDNLVKEFPDVKTKLVPVAFTEPIPNDTVSVRKDLPADLVTKIHDALVKFSNTDEGKKVLKDLYSIDGFMEGNDKDYDVVRNMAKDIGLNLKETLTPKKK